MQHIKPHLSINDIPKEIWDRAASLASPFLQYEFLSALEKSLSIGSAAGWIPLYFVNELQNTIFFSFIKTHSYGEYIFDWQWANAYQEHGLNYYPKLTSMIPFTPVTTPHFISPELKPDVMLKLINSFEAFYSTQNLSSSHILFLSKPEIPFFEEKGYLIRESIQYHFFNEDYPSFEGFLTQLKGRKSKQIRKERLFPEVSINCYTKEMLDSGHAERMYEFYLSTIDHKNAIDYLKKDFFLILFETMKNNILYIEATCQDQPVAGSLFFYDQNTLYGRYWGCSSEVENLHFELCYYQGIDFCIQNKFTKFEAGAQGEHKIPRGFRPIKTYSAHILKHEAFHQAVGNFIEKEKIQISEFIEILSNQLPFK